MSKTFHSLCGNGKSFYPSILLSSNKCLSLNLLVENVVFSANKNILLVLSVIKLITTKPD